MTSGPETPSVPDKGAAYEKAAFNFCKAATIILLTGPWALPVASGAASLFLVLAHLNGQRESRCILRRPLLIAAFWGIICLTSLWLRFRG